MCPRAYSLKGTVWLPKLYHMTEERLTLGLLVANSKLGLCGGHCKVGKGDLGAGGRQGGSVKACEEKYPDKSKESAAKALKIDTKVHVTLDIEETPLALMTHGS